MDRFSEMYGVEPADFGPHCGRALGPVFDQQKGLFKVPWTGLDFNFVRQLPARARITNADREEV